VAGLAAMSQPASASNDGLPDGSWHQACRNAYVRDGVLYAQCRRDDGRYDTASARVASCQAFGTRNGELFCEASDSASGGASGWGGSFRETCSDISVDKHGKLKANCRKDNGTYQSTNLSMWKCPYRRAANRDGRLVAKPGGASGGVARWEGRSATHAATSRAIRLERSRRHARAANGKAGTGRACRCASAVATAPEIATALCSASRPTAAALA
jgi:hypothetical protein